MPQPPHKGEYPADWGDIARRVKDAAAWRCIRCHHGHDPKAGRTLTVHHFDGDKNNVHEGNLMALCQACHLSVQARVDPNVPLMFAPSKWAMPFIAHFYESGRGTPSPLYDLTAWIVEYGAERWPAWAPKSRDLSPPLDTSQ